VAGGFHSLKILNGEFPAPYAARDTGAIGLGDGAAFAVLARGAGPGRIAAHAFGNELYHFTGNRPDGSGFDAAAGAMAAAAGGRRVWVKGHGTGTLEAGRLEAEAFARHFPDAPLVGWKGSLGHTLGSCGLVELAIALAALRAPGAAGAGHRGWRGAGLHRQCRPRAVRGGFVRRRGAGEQCLWRRPCRAAAHS
jgi:3-oxoacyl-[acyl-carrier-protein] synthase-1